MTIKATDSIKHQNNVENFEKEKKEEQAKKQEELKKQKEAQALIDSLSGDSKEKSYKGLKGDVKAELRELRRSGEITKEQFKEAKAYLKSAEFKDEKKKEFDSEARIYVANLAAGTEETKAKKVESEIRNTIDEQYENGEITKEQRDAYKSFAKRKGGFARFFGAKEKESNQLFRATASRNNVEQTKENGVEFKDKTQAKLNIAGLTTDQLYEIYDNNGGAADGTINYSWKKKQPGERDAILAALNKNEGGYEFDMNDVKEIGKTLGYNVEKKVDGGKVVRDIARGALLGLPGDYVNISQTQTVAGIATQSQHVQAYGVGSIVGGTIGGVASAVTQAHRVEDRAIPTNVPEGITTYNDYAAHLDNYSTERGAAIGKDIAKFYTDKDGNLNVEKMNQDLSKAAGTVDGVQTPLNYEEALTLLGELTTRKPEEPAPVIEQKKAKPLKGELNVEQYVIKRKEADATDCYTVKSGDNWDAVVRGKYQPKNEADVKALIRYLKDSYYEENKEDLNKLGITSSRGGFFPKVGEELCIPSEIKLANGAVYKYNQNGNVEAGGLGGDTVSYSAASNPFMQEVKDNKYNIKDGNGLPVAYGLNKDQVSGVIDSVKKINPHVEYTVNGWDK